MTQLRIIGLWLLVFHGLWADLKSTTGTLIFDANSDGQAEAVLNSNGFGLGTSSPSANLHVVGHAKISGTLCVGGNWTNSSNLNVNGTLGFGIQSVAYADTTGGNIALGQSSMALMDSSSGNINVTMPYAGNVSGFIMAIKKTSALNKVRIFGGGNSIDNYGVLELSSNGMGAVELVSNGSRWNVSKSYSTVQEIGGDNLVGYWGFEEASGNTAFSSSSALNGTYTGSITGLGVSGKIGKAATFNGTNTLLTMGSPAVRPTTEFTFSLWIKPVDVTSTYEMVSDFVWNGGSHYGTMAKVEAQAISIWAGNNTGMDFAKSADFLVSGTWQHLVIICKSGTVSLYQNGQAVAMADTTTKATIVSTGCNLMVGGPTNSFFKGTIDDLRIYNRALTTDEVACLYELGTRSL